MNATDTPHLQRADAELRLTALAPGADGFVVAIDPEHPAAARLLDLGFTPGTAVRVVRRAPMGDPVVYELRGMRLCLRGREAAAVHVRRA